MPLKLCVEHLGSGYLTCYVTNCIVNKAVKRVNNNSVSDVLQ